jgi:hypothetical protein
LGSPIEKSTSHKQSGVEHVEYWSGFAQDQMTVCYLTDTKKSVQKEYRTNKSGYEAFCRDIRSFKITQKKFV